MSASDPWEIEQAKCRTCPLLATLQSEIAALKAVAQDMLDLIEGRESPGLLSIRYEAIRALGLDAGGGAESGVDIGAMRQEIAALQAEVAKLREAARDLCARMRREYPASKDAEVMAQWGPDVQPQASLRRLEAALEAEGKQRP